MSARETPCPDCGSVDWHHCTWDGWVCLACGWEEDAL